MEGENSTPEVTVAQLSQPDKDETERQADTEGLPGPVATLNISPPEQVLEERYNKLKGIAVKLKKKIAEQNAEIESLKGEKFRFQNASKIQQEFDKAQDEVEQLKKSQSVLTKDLQKAIEETVRLKMSEAEAVSQAQSLSSSHKVLREKLDRLEKESGDAQDLKIRVETLEKELKEAKDAGHNAQQEKRQLQILSLEVTDYEKKLQDAYGCLEEKKVECEGILKELSQKDRTIEELGSQISTYKGTEHQLILAKESLQVRITLRFLI